MSTAKADRDAPPRPHRSAVSRGDRVISTPRYNDIANYPHALRETCNAQDPAGDLCSGSSVERMPRPRRSEETAMAVADTLAAASDPPRPARGRRTVVGFDAIVDAAAGGDETALAELFRAYQPMLLRYLRGRAAGIADDVAGDVWVAVARHLGRFVGDESGFRRWLFTIARCRLIEAHRKQARQRTAPRAPETFDEHDDHERKADRGDPATVVVDEMSAQQAVDLIVAGLSPDQAEVVLLRIVAGLGVAEVAAIMGRSPTSVRVLCHRALRHLRDQFPEGRLT
jgi:RNA polymerase sigma-70 factor, ECF subfamily